MSFKDLDLCMIHEICAFSDPVEVINLSKTCKDIYDTYYGIYYSKVHFNRYHCDIKNKCALWPNKTYIKSAHAAIKLLEKKTNVSISELLEVCEIGHILVATWFTSRFDNIISNDVDDATRYIDGNLIRCIKTFDKKALLCLASYLDDYPINTLPSNYMWTELSLYMPAVDLKNVTDNIFCFNDFCVSYALRDVKYTKVLKDMLDNDIKTTSIIEDSAILNNKEIFKYACDTKPLSVIYSAQYIYKSSSDEIIEMINTLPIDHSEGKFRILYRLIHDARNATGIKYLSRYVSILSKNYKHVTIDGMYSMHANVIKLLVDNQIIDMDFVIAHLCKIGNIKLLYKYLIDGKIHMRDIKYYISFNEDTNVDDFFNYGRPSPMNAFNKYTMGPDAYDVLKHLKQYSEDSSCYMKYDFMKCLIRNMLIRPVNVTVNNFTNGVHVTTDIHKLSNNSALIKKLGKK